MAEFPNICTRKQLKRGDLGVSFLFAINPEPLHSQATACQAGTQQKADTWRETTPPSSGGMAQVPTTEVCYVWRPETGSHA